jgi:hypothetical protein
MEINKLSFLTITYWNDFDLLDQQLYSFDRYYSSTVVHYIILNDDICHLEELKSIVNKYNTKNFYYIMHCNDVYNKNVCSQEQCKLLTGWYTQQILKLFASSIIDSEFYCVLDSKSHFNSKASLDSFVRYNMAVNILEHDCNIQGTFFTGARCSYQLLETNLDTRTLIQSIPPVVFKTSWVKLLLQYLNSKNWELPDILVWKDNFFCTEFYLYSAWLSKNNWLDQIVWISGMLSPITFDRHKLLRRL